MDTESPYSGKYFVLDTSSLLFDAACLTHYSSGQVFIPVSVLEELDKHKDRQDGVGKNARVVNRALYDLKGYGSLSRGVLEPRSKCTIVIFPEILEDIPASLNKEAPDNRILSVCFSLRRQLGENTAVTLITNDVNLCLKAEAFGIPSESFFAESTYKSSDYRGFAETVESDTLNIDQLYKSEYQTVAPAELDLIENQFLLVKNIANGKKSVRLKFENGRLRRLPSDMYVYHIRPMNNEQAYAIDLLTDPKIKLVTLTGVAGSGKTLLSIAAGLLQTLEEDHRIYERLIISRSLVLLSGKDRLGYLKGSLKEKLDPYLLPLKDAIDQVVGEERGFEYLAGWDQPTKKKAVIELEALQYIRGRSLRNVFFIVDEAQNLTLSELKAIVSRVGDNSKIVLLGDLDQVDNPYLSRYTSGLSQVIEKFKGSKLAGHVSLIDGVRSELATQAADRL